VLEGERQLELASASSAKPLYIFPPTLPNSLERDKTEIGGEPVASKHQYIFHMKSMEPTNTDTPTSRRTFHVP
jgi:oxalate decarboxylase